MNKRGLSDVIVTTLIILLAIVSVVIIWSFINDTLKETGEGIETELELSQTRFSIIGETVTLEDGNLNFFIERNPGGEVSAFAVVLENEEGQSLGILKYAEATVGELERFRVESQNINSCSCH
jgi:hypothetical protein